MVLVLCRDCRNRLRCSEGRVSEQHRLSLVAWAYGVGPACCEDYLPRWFRGIDGVLDHGKAVAV